jgi:hypothetical protein
MPVERDFVLTVDGDPIDEHGLWLERSSLEIGEASPSLSHTTAPGFNGSYDTTLRDTLGRAYLGSRTISFTLFTVGALDEIRESKRYLGGLHGRSLKVSWRVQKGWFRGTLAVGAWKDVWEGSGLTIASAKCSVYCDDPFMYADNKESVGFRLTAGGGASDLYANYAVKAPLFYGNREFYPSKLDITVDMAQRVRIYYMGDDGLPDEQAVVELSTTSAAYYTGVTLSFDMLNHTVKGSGGFLAPTLNSVFFPLRPGYTSRLLISVEGPKPRATCIMEYTPRWMF